MQFWYTNEDGERTHQEGIVLVKDVQRTDSDFEVLQLLKQLPKEKKLCKGCSNGLQRPVYRHVGRCAAASSNISCDAKFGTTNKTAVPDPDRGTGEQLGKHNVQATTADKIIACRFCSKLFVSYANADTHMMAQHGCKTRVLYQNVEATGAELEAQHR